MPHTTTNLLVHFIFSTKQRCALIKPDFEKDLYAYLGGVVRQIGGAALCVNGTRDHVHLLVRMPAYHSVAEVARLIKTNSSRWIHGRWPEHHLFAWQTGYGAFTVSESGLAAVKDYISNQQEHHKTRSFQEEFLAFIKKNKIAVDERIFGIDGLLRPFGACSRSPRYPRLTPWALFFRRFAATAF